MLVPLLSRARAGGLTLAASSTPMVVRFLISTLQVPMAASRYSSRPQILRHWSTLRPRVSDIRNNLYADYSL